MKKLIEILALILLLSACASQQPSSGAKSTETSAVATNQAASSAQTQANNEFASLSEASDDWAELAGQGRVGFQMPDFSVRTVSGEEFRLSEALKERELVLINLWASWCGPCVSEFPFLQEAYMNNQDRVAVIALSVEPEDSPELLKEFAEERHVSFQLGQDEKLRLAQCFNVTGIPTSLLVDRSGKVIWMETGAMRSAQYVENLFHRFLQAGNPETANGESHYRIRVVDQDGNPVPGAVVNFCSDATCQPVSADEAGVCDYAAVPGEYHIQILTLPAGYEAESEEALTLSPASESATLTVRKQG